jgi:probable rRNA maturation factor
LTAVASSANRKLLLSFSAAAGKEFVPYLRRHLAAAHRILRPPLRELSVALVGDRRMARLHEQFMGVAGPTDVLTFPLELERRPRRTKQKMAPHVLCGEVIICVPEARRQSRRQSRPQARRRDRDSHNSTARELLLYALHGLLHLSGFDDRTESGFRTMHRTEDDVLTQLGVGPVFAPDDRSPSPTSRRATRGRRGSAAANSAPAAARRRSRRSPHRKGARP